MKQILFKLNEKSSGSANIGKQYMYTYGNLQHSPEREKLNRTLQE